MKRKWLAGIGAAILISMFATAALAGNPVKLIVNGREIKPDVSPQLINGRIMVPVRWVAESLGADVKWDKQTNAVMITKKDKISTIVASIPDEEVVLSAAGEKDGMYKEFTLEIKGSKRFFDWKNVSNPTYAPQILLSDIEHNGQEELIIILTTDTGTGVHVTEAHIINPETLLETYIDNPKAIFLKNVKTKMTENEVEISIGDRKTVIDIGKFNIAPKNLFLNTGFGNICRFEVVNDELRVNIGVQISPACFIGDVQISYILKNNMYQANKIEFKNTREDTSSEKDIDQIMQRWQQDNHYSYHELIDLNNSFISPTLSETLGFIKWGDTSMERFDLLLSCFSADVKDSSGWKEFTSLAAKRDPVFTILWATSTPDHISATLLGDLFPGFVVVPVVMDIEIKKQTDSEQWLFTKIEKVRAYESLEELKQQESLTYEMIVQMENYRRQQQI